MVEKAFLKNGNYVWSFDFHQNTSITRHSHTIPPGFSLAALFLGQRVIYLKCDKC